MPRRRAEEHTAEIKGRPQPWYLFAFSSVEDATHEFPEIGSWDNRELRLKSICSFPFQEPVTFAICTGSNFTCGYAELHVVESRSGLRSCRSLSSRATRQFRFMPDKLCPISRPVGQRFSSEGKKARSDVYPRVRAS